MNLYELSAKYQQLLNLALAENELSDEMLNQLNTTEENFDEKILAYTSIVKELEAKIDGFKKAIESIEKRAASCINNMEYMKERIKTEMQNCNKKRIENDYHDVKLVLNNPKVDYTDKSLIPEQFIRHQIKEIIEPATSEILKFLKEGNEIPGARLVRETRLAIR